MTSRYAHAERAALADSLAAAGPDAPTLCGGWTTRDLAAHLILRERRPDAAPGILLPPLRARAERVQAGIARGDYATLVDTVRRTPWWQRLPAIEEAINLLELFVHHEDIRRAVPGWTPRELPEGYRRALAGRAKATAKLAARRFPAQITVQPTVGAAFQVGAGGEKLELRGTPEEILMFFFGRQQASNVDVDGPAALVDRLRGARLGL